jgi:ribosome-associated translation inhibitor RaiA
MAAVSHAATAGAAAGDFDPGQQMPRSVAQNAPPPESTPPMQSTQITLHNMRRSPALSARIRDLAERLEAHYPDILNIHVCVSHAGEPAKKPASYCVSLRVRIPGQEVAAGHESEEDVYVAVREAFIAMRVLLARAADAARRAAWDPAKAT